MNKHYIHGAWVDASGESSEHVSAAVRSARDAAASWFARGVEERAARVGRFVALVEQDAEKIAGIIARDTGKPLWEARTEVAAMKAKITLSIDAYHDRRGKVEKEVAGGMAETSFMPHGVAAVLGPFNLPGHLPNAHIVPALIAGNTVVFKPSELGAQVGHALSKLWAACELPPGVFNMVQGGRDVGQSLLEQDIDAVLFTGGYAAGKHIHEMFSGRPEVIVALEMGGNNPLAVTCVRDMDAAVYWTIQSAYITAGQRCTCARRLIVPRGNHGDSFLARLSENIPGIVVGLYDSEPEPFMGPVISSDAAENVLSAQDTLVASGAEVIVETRRLDDDAMLSPGLIDVTDSSDRRDQEIFGPLLQVIRVADFDALLEEANNTQYGLSAGLLSDSAQEFERFRSEVRAGIINWNGPTTGASGTMPFGGMGRSGNHRPSGYYAADYCAYPVASVIKDALMLPEKLTPGLTL